MIVYTSENLVDISYLNVAGFSISIIFVETEESFGLCGAVLSRLSKNRVFVFVYTGSIFERFIFI